MKSSILNNGLISPKSFLFLIISLLPVILLNSFNYSGWENYLEVASILFLFCCIFFFFQFIFLNEQKSILALLILLFPTLFFEFFNVLILNQYLSHDNIKSVYYTNWNETIGFFKDYVKYAVIPLFLLLTLLLILFLRINKTPNKPKRKVTLGLISLVFGVISFSIPLIKNLNSYIGLSDKNILAYTLREDFFKKPPLNFYFRLNELRSYLNNYGKYLKLRETFQFKPVIQVNEQPDIIVLVIGEAMRYKNWTVNGYERLTSPNLLDQNNLISFHKHFSNANQTSNSIPTLLTRASPKNFEKAFQEKSIISLFKEAGYQTYWISNQFIFFLENEDEPDSLIANLEIPEITDLATLEPFEAILNADDENKIFIVINLIGNHGIPPLPYKNHFKPNTSAKKIIDYSESKEELINDYDNKILFQDYILGKLIKELEKKEKNALLMFTSDHGIRLFDDEDSSIFGYGSDRPNLNELHIPLFIWYSENFKKNNIEKLHNLKKNQNKGSDNLTIFFTLSALSGIGFDNFLDHKNLASNNYVELDSFPVFFKKRYEYFQIP
ncbi:MAG: phosphoethanolamine transferase [Cecembia sp.]